MSAQRSSQCPPGGAGLVEPQAHDHGILAPALERGVVALAHADTAEAVAQPRPSRQPEPAPLVPEKYRAWFVSTMEADVAQMVRALEMNDQRLLGRTLHRMRGALSVMQMTAITERLEALEDRLRSAGLDAAAQAEGQAVVQLLRDTLAQV